MTAALDLDLVAASPQMNEAALAIAGLIPTMRAIWAGCDDRALACRMAELAAFLEDLDDPGAAVPRSLSDWFYEQSRR